MLNKKLITLNTYLKNRKKKRTLQVNRRKQITERIVEIIEIENETKIEKTNETVSWFFKKMNTVEKLLARLIKKIK